MKTKITKANLAEAMGAVGGLVQKDAMSVFSRVRLDAVGPNVSLAGSSGEITVLYRFKAETEADGIVTLPGRLMCSFTSAMPNGVVEIAGESGGKMKLAGGDGVTFRLASYDAADFPKMKEPKEDAASVYVPAVTLREMLRKVKFAAFVDGTRKSICGVNVKLGDGKLEMTATDGRRLAHVEYGVDSDKRFDVTLPNKSVAVLFALLGGCDSGDVTVTSDGSSAVFLCDKWRITVLVIEDKYPEWRRVVPSDVLHEAKIARVPFLEALKRAALASDDNGGVKIALENGKAKFDAKSELSSASMSIDCCAIADGGKVEMTFNPQLLTDALEATDEDEFTVSFGAATAPVVIKGTIPWLTVVMPLRTM